MDQLKTISDAATAWEMSHSENQLKEAIAALQQSETLFRALATDLQVGLLIQLANSEIVLSNPKALELLGLTQDQLVGKTSMDPDWNVIHADGTPFPGHTHPVPQSIASRSPVRNVVMGVYRPRTKDRVWLLVNADPQLAVDGSVLQVVCTFSDLTETYRSREALDKATELQRTTRLFQEREAFTQSILNSVSAEIAVLSRNGTIVAVNEAWRRFARENSLTHGELPRKTDVGANYLEVCASGTDAHAAASVSPADGIKAILEGKLRSFTHEYPCHSPDQQRWFHMHVTPFEGAKIVGAVVTHTDITRRKLAEISQRANEAELQQAQHIAHIGSWYWDRHTDATTASEELCRIFGYKTFPPFADQCGALYSEQVWKTLNAEVQKTLQTGLGYDLELPALRSDGAPIWIKTRCNPVRNEDHAIVGLRGTVQDITASRATLQQLNEAQERLQLVVEATIDGIWDWDIPSGKVFRSPRYLALVGAQPSDDTQDLQFFQRTVHPDDLPHALRCIEAHREGHLPSIEYEYRLVTATDKVTWLKAKGRIVSRDAQGLPLRIVGTLSDITEQKQAEMELRASESRYRSVLDGAADAIFVSDPQGRYLYANQKASLMLGYTIEELLQMSAADLTPSEDAQHSADTLASLNHTGHVTDELLLLRKNGSRVRVEINAILLPDGTTHGACRDITARHALEESLDASRRSIQLLLQNAPTALAIFDTEMRYLAVSQRWLGDYGVALQDVIGKVHFEVFPEIDEAWRSVHRRALGGEVVKEVHDLFRRQDGPVQWLRWELHPWKNADESIGGIVIFTEDVTELRQAQATAHQLSQAVEQSPESVLITNLEGAIEYVNASFLKISGYSRDEVIGKNPRFMQSGKTPAATFEALWQTISGGNRWKGELCNKRKDGTEYIDFAIISPLRQSDGQVTHYVSVQEDITARKEVANRLHIQQELLKMMGAMTQTGGWAFDPATGKGTWTNECARIHDLPDDTPIDVASGIDFYVEEHRPTVIRAVREAIEQAKPYDVEVEILSAKGRRKWVRTLGEAVVADGKVVMVQGAMQDISTWKQMLAELETHRSHLEKLVTTRTTELTVAKTAAEAANLAKSAFLANMSHEIRSPLNAISGMSRLVRSEPLSKPQKERLDKLDAAAMHLNATINDILDLSKIEAGRLDLSDGPVHLQALVSSVMDMVQDRATAKRIALHSAVDSTSDQLYGDETRLKQSLLNYAGNAIKFTESGTITLGVSIAEENEASALLRFEVCDSGIGITEVHRSKLFTPFEQVDNGTSRKYGGTGLGLAITKKLAEAMGGEVGVASSLGVGSTFWFTACLRKGARVAPETEALDARDPKLVLQQDYRGRCVLLAEDDAFNQEIGRIVLEDVGFAVDVAEDGLAAVALAARNAYDLILMDIQMPNLDGLGATQQIRQIPSCRAIPIVAMTANAFEEDRLHCLEAGMNDFVTKPMEPRVLYAAIVRWLKHKAVTEKGDS